MKAIAKLTICIALGLSVTLTAFADDVPQGPEKFEMTLYNGSNSPFTTFKQIFAKHRTVKRNMMDNTFTPTRLYVEINRVAIENGEPVYSANVKLEGSYRYFELDAGSGLGGAYRNSKTTLTLAKNADVTFDPESGRYEVLVAEDEVENMAGIPGFVLQGFVTAP